MKKTQLVLGSLGGAVAIHLAMACMTGPNPLAAMLTDASAEAMAQTGDAAEPPDGAGEAATTSCACSASPSGSRLKGVFVAGADGLKAYDTSTFYDSQLQTNCKLTALSDAQLYCAPAVPPQNSSNSGLLFSDSACTSLVYFAASTDVVPKYAYYTILFSATLDAALQKVFPISAATTAPQSTYVWEYATQKCVAFAPTVGGAWYTTGTELLPASFVALSGGHD